MTRPPTPTATQIAGLIERLDALADVDYADVLAANIMAPEPAATAAFRSPQLAIRSLTATKYLLSRVNQQFAQRPDESRGSWGKRAANFRDRVGLERRTLEVVLAGLRAQRGVLAAAPNPRNRAMRELARRHPVEYLRIVREEQAKLRELAAREKERRRQSRTEQRQQERDQGSR